MKILTYNIHYWEGADGITDVDRIIDVIAASEADIVGLNEVYHPALTGDFGQPALSYMAERLGMNFVYGQAQTFTLAFNRPGRSFGNALLSRWPILASAAHHLTTTPGHASRGLLEARILLPDQRRTLTVYVTHLEPSDEAVRLTQTQALLTWAGRDRAQPHVLMGDFNAFNPADYTDPERFELFRQTVEGLGLSLYEPQTLPRLLKAGYVDAWTAAGAGPAETCCNEPAPLFRIDYVFLSQVLAPHLVACRRWDEEPALLASDHLPVLAEVDF